MKGWMDGWLTDNHTDKQTDKQTDRQNPHGQNGRIAPIGKAGYQLRRNHVTTWRREPAGRKTLFYPLLTIYLCNHISIMIPVCFFFGLSAAKYENVIDDARNTFQAIEYLVHFSLKNFRTWWSSKRQHQPPVPRERRLKRGQCRWFFVKFHLCKTLCRVNNAEHLSLC